MSNFFSDLTNRLNSENTILMSETDTSSECTGYIDTGSYTLNALLSGSMYAGVPNNKVICFNGVEATGKTFFLLSIARHFMTNDDKSGVYLFDTEQDKTKALLENKGLDISRVINSQPITVQEFRTQVLQFLDTYIKYKDSERLPVLMMLDSLGQLSTTKEMADAESGSETKDMTRAQVIKSVFRVIRTKLAKAQVPLLISNHVYSKIGGMFPEFESGGGSGPKYSSDIIVFLSKAQFKETDGTIAGNIVNMKLNKSRFTREKATARTLIRFDGGIDRYFGLLDIALKHGILEKQGGRILINGSKVYETKINREPEKYYTEELMEKLEKACNKEFLYSNSLADYELEYNPVKNKDQS